MSRERIANQGRLAELTQQATEQKYRIESHRDSLRDELDPLEDIEIIDGEKVRQLAFAIASQLIEYEETLKKIGAARAALGYR